MNRLTSGARSFGAFWWDFVIGDDWRIAVGVAIALAVTGALVHFGATAWWLLPVTIPVLFGLSLWRATRRAA